MIISLMIYLMKHLITGKEHSLFGPRSYSELKIGMPVRHLNSWLLHENPMLRINKSRALSHPFLQTGTKYSRLADEMSEFDVFLSYRVAHVEALYNELAVNRGIESVVGC